MTRVSAILTRRLRFAIVGAAGIAALLAVSVSWGQSPAAEGAPAAKAATKSAPVSIAKAERLRADMELDMEKIAIIVEEAKGERDFVRVTCARDKEAQGADILLLATGELLIIRDPSQADAARVFAGEKLEASAQAMDNVVVEALACSGEQGPEDEDDSTRTDENEPLTIPRNDMTSGFGSSPVPPAGADGWPPVTSPYY